MMNQKKVLEINPRHPIIKELNDIVTNGEPDAKAVLMVRLLYDSASLSSGYSLEDPLQLSDTLNKLVAESLHIDPYATVDEEVDEELPEPEPVKKAEDPEDSEHEDL